MHLEIQSIRIHLLKLAQDHWSNSVFFRSDKTSEQQNSDNLIAAAAQCVAKIFHLDGAELVQQWLSVSGKTLVITLPFACLSKHEVIESALASILEQHQVVASSLQITTSIPSFETKQPGIINIKNIIAVASGKGGVGKSATAVNLAFALMQEGAKVGILDADIYGPSLPTMLGNKSARPSSTDSKTMQPISAHGVAANSIGYLVAEEDAAIWRGPMASRALMQLLTETRWPVLDYLIVDMPPGTGDVQLTMAQKVPLTGAVVVTTPQDLALADAQKGIAMFEKVDIPVLGLVENMGAYACSNCGHVEYIFSQHGGEKLAERYDLPLLGSLPLSLAIREHADAGNPLLLAEPESTVSHEYRAIAVEMGLQLAMQANHAQQSSSHIKGDPIAFVAKE